MDERRVRFGIKLAQMTGTYAGIRDDWLEADHLGFDTARSTPHVAQCGSLERGASEVA